MTYLEAVGVAMLILAAVLFVRRLSALLRGASALGRVQGHEVRTTDEESPISRSLSSPIREGIFIVSLPLPAVPAEHR
jgi:hypothetical protein